MVVAGGVLGVLGVLGLLGVLFFGLLGVFTFGLFGVFAFGLFGVFALGLFGVFTFGLLELFALDDFALADLAVFLCTGFNSFVRTNTGELNFSANLSSSATSPLVPFTVTKAFELATASVKSLKIFILKGKKDYLHWFYTRGEPACYSDCVNMTVEVKYRRRQRFVFATTC